MKRVRTIPDFKDPFMIKEESVDERGIKTITLYYGARDEYNNQTQKNGTEGLWKAINDDKGYYVYYFKLADYEGGRIEIDDVKYMNDILKKREELVKKAKEYSQLTNYGQTFSKMNKLMDSWKAIDHLNIAYEQELWTSFTHYFDEFYAHLKAYHDQNREKKIQLIEAVKELNLENDLNKATNKVKNIQKVWKTVGNAGKKFDNELWNDFQKACDEFFEKKRLYWKEHILPSQNEALIKKEKLIEDAIHAAQLDINEGVEEFRKLMALWKSSGYAGEKDQELWEKFNSHQQFFYNKRHTYYDQKYQEMHENEKKKRALIEEAKSILNESNYDRHYTSERTNRMKQIMSEFKTIASSGYASDQKLWTSIRQIMDEYFDNYGKYSQFIKIL